MGLGSKHNALCLPPGLPPAVLDYHGDGVLSGTSGWNSGPSCSEEDRCKAEYSNSEHLEMTVWLYASLYA